MTKIIDRTGKGTALSAADNDANLSSLSGINEAVTGTTYTVTIDDQNRTLEFSNASPIAVTMTAIATISAALHTDDFEVTLLNIGAGTVTATRGSTDTFLSGGTTLVLSKGESVTLQLDSTLGIWNILYPGRTVPIKVAGTGLSTTMEITSGLGGTEYDIIARIDSDNASGGVYKLEFNGDTVVANYFSSISNGVPDNDNNPGLSVNNATRFLILKGRLFVEPQSQDIHLFGNRYFSIDNAYDYFHIILIGSNTAITGFSIKETTTAGKFKTSSYINMIRVN